MSKPRLRLALVATVFLGSAITKIAWPSESHPHAGDPAWYRFVLSHKAALSASLAEIVLASLLLSPCWRSGVRLALALVSLFLFVTGAIIRSGHSVASCGCFGQIALEEAPHVSLLIGLGLLLLSCLDSQGGPAATALSAPVASARRRSDATKRSRVS